MSQGRLVSEASKAPAWLIGACLLSVYLIWGTTYFAIKVGVQGAPPFFLMGTRFVVAGGALTIWQMLRGRKLPTAKQWRNAALPWRSSASCRSARHSGAVYSDNGPGAWSGSPSRSAASAPS
jgi:hypothetical protein